METTIIQRYWSRGKQTIEKQKDAQWGDGLINQLSKDLLQEFPHIRGFSAKNLRSCRQFYLYYNQEDIIWQQVVAKLPEEIRQALPEIKELTDTLNRATKGIS